ncbi:hypothetical protein AUC61_14185 [Pseudomonas sp. S25]|uniref:Uncharacterized protein n=1 Tax=Pseudomonas maioricensis TaxID=1766623 RepID=A0ABS9ZP97_9PSED|nr:hypothetical protein [Pseudomonas sp. S25]
MFEGVRFDQRPGKTCRAFDDRAVIGDEGIKQWIVRKVVGCFRHFGQFPYCKEIASLSDIAKRNDLYKYRALIYSRQ